MLRILPILALILFAFSQLHRFIFHVITRSIENQSFVLALQILFIVCLLSIPLGLFASRLKNKQFKFITWIGYTWLGVFTILLSMSLVEAILLLFVDHNYSYWVLIAGGLISLWSLYRGLSFPRVITHTLENKKPEGLTLVQISDLHVGMLHLNKKWFDKVIQRVREIKPHIFVITGDLVEGHFDEVESQLNALNDLPDIPHKFYITGNHEYIHGGAIWETKLRKLGFQVLHNTHEILNFNGAEVMIAGVPDKMIRRFDGQNISQPDLALKTNAKTDYKILLAHQPSSVYDLKTETCDLILTGHTHGGQIFPFHLLVRAVQPVVTGFKTINNIKVFAHQGTGLWGPPMRWFSRSEIVIFKWT